MPYIDETLILYILFGILALIALWVYLLERRIKKLTGGAGGASLENIIGELSQKSHEHGKTAKEFEKALTYLNEKLARCILAGEIVRFDAFGESGGKQSFTVAFCDEDGNGILLSSLYGRDKTLIYAKKVKNFKGEQKLSPEEEAALSEAKKKLPKE